MKQKFIVLLSILTILISSVSIQAEDVFDISPWCIKMLTNESDQDSDVIVSKFYNDDNRNQYAFCIEPGEDFLSAKHTYCQTINNDEYIYSLVKAYDKVGKDDINYYIATQLLIWEHINGIKYTFTNDEYTKYDFKKYKDVILEELKPKSSKLSATKTIEAYVNEEITLDEDYTDYLIESEGVEILENSKGVFRFKIVNEEPTNKELVFIPKDTDKTKSLILQSDGSQDLYYFNGEYNNLEPFSIYINTLKKSDNINISYTKKDENNLPISGAEFTLYALDENSDEFIYFINTDKDINLYEMLLPDVKDYTEYEIEVSERYEKYLNDEIVNTSELGCFPYKIYKNGILQNGGIVYVSNDVKLTNNLYTKNAIRSIFKGFSDNLEINSINSIPRDNRYYLCESKPKNGYTYKNNPCVLIDGNDYENETYNFINSYRSFTLRLMKESPQEIPLNGAEFNVSYIEDDKTRNVRFTTGALQIQRENNSKYLILKYEDNETRIIEFKDDEYFDSNALPGKYYYYQTNEQTIDDSKLINIKTIVNGGFEIEDIPYSSKIRVEETKAPEGYIISEPVYYIEPDISYDEITLKNYRVNYLDILPAKKFRIPKTCVK